MTAPGSSPVGGTRVAYLGPEGTVTHQAALEWARRPGTAPSGTLPDDAARGAVTAEPLDTVKDVHDVVAAGTADVGVVAIESSVEG